MSQPSRDKTIIKIHMKGVVRPYCRPQQTHYQPHKVTDDWDQVTCARCRSKRFKTGSYATKAVARE